MTERIEQAMRDELKSLDWMSDATKQKALEKLASLVNKIGYPDRWRDYRALSVSRDDFAGNVARGNLFEAPRAIAQTGQPVHRGEWGMPRAAARHVGQQGVSKCKSRWAP